MKKTVILLVVLILLSGCDLVNERERLRVEEKREENRQLQLRVDLAHAKAEIERVAWEGRATLLAVLSTAGMPYYFGTLLTIVSYFVFMWTAFPERFDRKDKDK